MESTGQLIHQQFSAISVLYVRRMHNHFQQHSHRIHDYMSLSSEHLLTGVIATKPPFSVVFTDWLSIVAAVGIAPLHHFRG